jgi:hypothetical protein
VEQQKKRKPGRPRFPRGTAKSRIVPVRFANGDLKVIEARAKENGQTVSEWIRSTLNAALSK